MNTSIKRLGGICWATISYDVSCFLWIPAAMTLVSLPICVANGEWTELGAFVITCVSLLLASGVCRYWGRGAQAGPMAQTLVSVAIGWAIIAAFGGLPLWLSALMAGPEASPTLQTFGHISNALFEGMSGFTSAGLTMVIRPSQLPYSLQWWRSLMQWTGGVGVVAFAIALLNPAHNNYALFQAEGRQIRLRLTVSSTVRRIMLIYTGYTGFSILLFRLLGMPWWEAINHSMSAIATGGFSVTDGSMSVYDTPVLLAIMLTMILGAIAFSSHDQVIQQRQPAVLWQDRQHRLLLILLLLGTVLVAVERFTIIGKFDWLHSSFQWVSALTTCGFSSQPIQFWSDTNKLLLSLAMILGGAAGSTVRGNQAQSNSVAV